ncbi:MAG: hypothetical protein LLG24_00360 [Actinomycetia bacterium]|nr:hypothetical protein [Actinomycetes bacterium]
MKRSAARMPLLPATLRGRLTVTILLSSVLLFVLVYGLTMAATEHQARQITQAQALADLNAVAVAIDLEARELDSYIIAYTEWDDFYERTLDFDPGFVSEEVDPWLRERSGASAVVWLRRDGALVNSYGSDADVRAVREYLMSRASTATAAVVSLPSGPALLVSRPVTSDPPRASAGYLAIARPLADVLSAYTSPARLQSLSVHGAGPSDSSQRWTTLESPDGFTDVRGRYDKNGAFQVRATLPVMDGRNAAVISFTEADARESASGIEPYVVGLALGLISLLIGLGLGLVLSTTITKPMVKFSTYLKDRGYRAIEGLPFEEKLELSPILPDEFKDLGAVIQDLLTQLSIRQAELKRANELALAAEEALRTVVNDSSEGKLLIVDGVVDIANRAASGFLDKPLGMLLKRPLTEVFENLHMATEDGREIDADELMRRALENPVPIRCESGPDADRWMMVSVVGTSDGGSYLLTIRNITEERHLEEMRAEIVSLVTHDLRAPLTVMNGYLDLLERPLPDEKRARALEEMRAAASRMESLLEDLLDTARATHGLGPRRWEPVPLARLAHEVAEASTVATGRVIAVTAHADPWVQGDPVKLRQALDNLVMNACKHTPDDSRVEIVIDATPKTAIISVEDNGPGIPAGQHEVIFERYRQLGGRSAPEGLGLGLYIVRAIARSHGGSARAEDREGGGARFVIELPLLPQPAADATS